MGHILNTINYHLSKKSGEIIKIDNGLELRHQTGYTIRVTNNFNTWKVDVGYITYQKHANIIQEMQSLEFSKAGLNDKQIIEKIVSFMNGRKK